MKKSNVKIGKRFVIITLLVGISALVLVASVGVFIGKQYEQQYEQYLQNKAEQVVQALKNAGFGEAYLDDRSYNIYIDSSEKTYISFASNYVDFWRLESTTDIPKLLNAVMPLFDSDFSNDGSMIVMELRNLRRKYSDGTVDSGYMGEMKFNGKRYSGYLDETDTYIESIWVAW